jgi:hypothetical protein
MLSMLQALAGTNHNFLLTETRRGYLRVRVCTILADQACSVFVCKHMFLLYPFFLDSMLVRSVTQLPFTPAVYGRPYLLRGEMT